METLPCPHCGCRAINVRHMHIRSGDTLGYEVHAECHDCGSRGPRVWLCAAFSTESREEQAVAQWNRRIDLVSDLADSLFGLAELAQHLSEYASEGKRREDLHLHTSYEAPSVVTQMLERGLMTETGEPILPGTSTATKEKDTEQ